MLCTETPAWGGVNGTEALKCVHDGRAGRWTRGGRVAARACNPACRRGPPDARTRCLSLCPWLFFFLTFCHFSKKKACNAPAVLHVMCRGPTRAFPRSHTRTQNQDGAWPGPPRMESRLLGPNLGQSEPRRSLNIFICVCIERTELQV